MTWRDRAACKGKGLAPFFAGRGTREGRAAITLCWLCPVREACLEDCLVHEKTDALRLGIRGGLGPNERAELVRRRRDG